MERRGESKEKGRENALKAQSLAKTFQVELYIKRYPFTEEKFHNLEPKKLLPTLDGTLKKKCTYHKLFVVTWLLNLKEQLLHRKDTELFLSYPILIKLNYYCSSKHVLYRLRNKIQMFQFISYTTTLPGVI